MDCRVSAVISLAMPLQNRHSVRAASNIVVANVPDDPAIAFLLTAKRLVLMLPVCGDCKKGILQNAHVLIDQDEPRL